MDRGFYLHSEIVINAGLASAEYDSTLGQVIGCELNGNLIAGQDADVMLAHLSRDVRGNDVSVLELNPEKGIGQGFQDRAFHFNVIFFCH